jgi:hypothetical protein
MPMWTHDWRRGYGEVATEAAAVMSLVSDRDGVAESARDTAEAAVRAIGRLVNTLIERGALTTDDAKSILELYAFTEAE